MNYGSLRSLFSDVKQTYQNHHREIAVILEFNNRLAALIIDEVVAIEPLSWDHWRAMDEVTTGSVEGNYMLGIAEIPEKELPVVVLDVPKYFL